MKKLTKVTNHMDAAEKLIIAARESFNYHPAYEMPEGYRLLLHAQKHINNQRNPDVLALALRTIEQNWNNLPKHPNEADYESFAQSAVGIAEKALGHE